MEWQSNKLFKDDEERMLYSNILTIVAFLFSLVLVVSGITLSQNIALNNQANANALAYSFKLHISTLGQIIALVLLASAAVRWIGSKRKSYNGLYLMLSWIFLFIVAVYTVYLLIIY